MKLLDLKSRRDPKDYKIMRHIYISRDLYRIHMLDFAEKYRVFHELSHT